MAAGLNNDVTGKAQMIAQRKKRFWSSIFWQILRFGTEGEARLRPEDMAMRIDCSDRWDEVRFR